MSIQRSAVDEASSLVNGRTSRRGVLKFGVGLAGSVALGSVFAACATREDNNAPAEVAASDDGDGEEPGDDDPREDDDSDASETTGRDDFDVDELIDAWLDEFEPFEAPELDVERSSVEIQSETYDVWAYQNTWVGAVTDDLFIAFSIEEGYSDGSGEVAAYACDSDDASVYLTGELVDGEANLDDCVDKIELSIVDGEIVGTLTLENEEPQSFVAVPSTGDAGLYRAETIARGEIEFTPRWIVLDDGRQRGGIKCRNPWTGDCMYCPRPR
jgi:hypothetical protein